MHLRMTLNINTCPRYTPTSLPTPILHTITAPHNFSRLVLIYFFSLTHSLTITQTLAQYQHHNHTTAITFSVPSPPPHNHQHNSPPQLTLLPHHSSTQDNPSQPSPPPQHSQHSRLHLTQQTRQRKLTRSRESTRATMMHCFRWETGRRDGE